jgi:hypothetical protein
MKRLALTWALVLIAAFASLRAESLTASRTITENLTAIVLPLCGVPGIARRIAESAGIPAGIESVPACYLLDPLPPPPWQAETITFLGMTVADALDRLVALDGRYRWVESDGVIVLRPLEAWQDAHHFMNEVISGFGFADQNVTWAAVMLGEAMHGRPIVPPTIETPLSTPQGNEHFSVSPRTTSILEAATAVVRAHGSLSWTLSYCKPERRPEYAWFMLGTFDHSGSGAGPKLVPDQNGKLHSACPSPPVRR